MNKKLSTVLLIDDDEDINFINKLVIEDIAGNIQIKASQSVEQAMEYIASDGIPDLIFLDINMPIASGWDFIEEYKKLTLSKEHCLIVMLTSSVNVDDKEKALSISEINEYMSKPLTNQIMEKIFKKYFQSKP